MRSRFGSHPPPKPSPWSLRPGFLVGALVAVLGALALILTGCATPIPDPVSAAAGGGGPAGATRGGDADGESGRVSVNSVIAQPGADAMVSDVSNEDQVTSTQAGDAPQLVIGAGGGAARAFLEGPDPVGAAMAERLLATNEALLGLELTPENAETRAQLRGEVEALEDRLTAHQRARLEAARELVPDFAALEQVVFAVVQVKTNGSDVAKVSAEALTAAAASLEAAVAPALERAKN